MCLFFGRIASSVLPLSFPFYFRLTLHPLGSGDGASFAVHRIGKSIFVDDFDGTCPDGPEPEERTLFRRRARYQVPVSSWQRAVITAHTTASLWLGFPSFLL